jgi:hypothetical protein
MKFTAKLQIPRLRLRQYRSQLEKELTEITKEAARVWLNAAVVDLATTGVGIPVWSGASRETFIHLARSVSFLLAIHPSPTAPDRRGLGERRSSGGLSIDPQAGKYHFQYHTDLFYLIYNEFNNANTELGFHLKHPGPYHFQRAGQQAFERFAEKVRLPNPFDFLHVREIKV